MKAAAFYEYGPAEAMQYADIPDPVIGAGDVLVQVQACGVNHSDLDSRAGTSRWPFELPMVLGAEFAGTVVGVGDHSGPIRTGDRVTAFQQYSCGHCARCARWRPDLCESFEVFGTTRWGGYGELVCVPSEVVVPLEPEDDLLAMAAGQCAVSTAWHMVNRLALIRPGDLVLIPSASGGVAGALVQCAKLAGATVVATVGRAAKAAQVASLGADVIIVRGERDLLRTSYGPPTGAASTPSSTPWAARCSRLICPCSGRKAHWSSAARTRARSCRSTWFPCSGTAGALLVFAWRPPMSWPRRWTSSGAGPSRCPLPPPSPSVTLLRRIISSSTASTSERCSLWPSNPSLPERIRAGSATRRPVTLWPVIRIGRFTRRIGPAPRARAAMRLFDHVP